MSDATTRDANVRLNAEIDPYRREVAQASVETDKLALSVDKLSSKLDGLTKRAGKKLMLFGAGGAAGITALGIEAGAFEKKLSVLNATAAITDKSMGATTKQIRNLSKEFPIARDEAAALVTTMDKLGASSGKNLRIVSESMVKLSAATGEGLTGLTTEMVELQKQMGTLQTGTMDVFANSLLQVSKSAGVSATGVLQFASAIAPAARAAEISQSAVLGVSTAFTKAGADGYAAASTFNSMLTDITRQIVTGSPEIAKYSNLIGVTGEEFAKMDKGQAIAAIFEAISKQGPDAIKTLDRLGYDGVRAVKSIQAVSQSGGLRQAIDEATGAYSNTQALDKGSAAAMGGLYDQLERTKNTLQDITTEAGAPALVFFTELETVVNDLLGPVSDLAGGLGKIAVAMGGMGSLAAVGLGGAMALAGIKTAIAGAGFLAKGLPSQGLRGGFQLGASMANGELPRAGSQGARSLERATAGQMRWYERPLYLAGQGAGMALGERGVGPSTMGRVLAAPLRGGRFIMDAQTEFYRNSSIPGPQRNAPLLGNLGNMARAVRNPGDFMTGFRGGGLADVKSLTGSARDPEDFGKKVREATKATMAHTAAQNAGIGATRMVTTQSGALARSFLQLQYAGVKASASLIAQGAGGAARGLGSAALGLVGGPVQAGIAAAVGIGYMAYSSRNQGQVDIGDSAPIDKYNAALGIATSELGTFTDAVKSATIALPKPKDLAGTKDVSNEVVSLARMPKRELTNDLFSNLKSKDSRAAMMQLMGVTDPRQMQLIQADLVQSQGRTAAQKASNTFFKRTESGKGPDYAALVKDITGEQGQGFKGSVLGRADPTGAKITGAIYESLLGQYGANAKKFNTGYAGQVQVNDTGKFLGAAFQGLQKQKFRGEVWSDSHEARTATTAVKGFENAYLDKQRTGFNAAEFARKTQGMTGKEQSEYFFEDFLGKNKNKKVAGYIKELHSQGVDFGGMSGQGLLNLQRQDDSSYRTALKQQGRIGLIGLQNQTIQKAVANPGDVNAQYQGVNELTQKAREIGGTFSGTDAELQKLKAAIKDTTDPLYQMAEAAQQFNASRRAEAMGYQGRVGKLSTSVSSFRQVQQEDPNAPDHDKRLDAARQELVGQKSSYADYMRSIIQAQKNFAISMERGEEDMQISIARGNEDYQRSMMQSEQDFYRQRKLSQRDFGISMRQQTEDFNLSVSRGQEDFNRGLQRQSEDLASTITNPFHRLQSQFTSSSGTLIENLREQNQKIEEQSKNLAKARQMGLSRRAIDQLNLADPNNARQLDRTIRDLEQAPEEVGKINKQAKRRQGAVEDLTENPLNKQYRRAMEDYQRGLDRATSDFEKSQRRANEANARMLSDMATNFGIMTARAAEAHQIGLTRMGEDFNRQQKRAREDLARMSEEIAGDFTELYKQAIDLVTQNMGKMGDKVIRELDKIKKKFPELFADLYGNLDPKVGTTRPPSPDSLDHTKATTSRKSTSSTTTVDQSTNFTGAVTVQASDPDKMAEDLARKARIRKLTRAGVT